MILHDLWPLAFIQSSIRCEKKLSKKREGKEIHKTCLLPWFRLFFQKGKEAKLLYLLSFCRNCKDLKSYIWKTFSFPVIKLNKTFCEPKLYISHLSLAYENIWYFCFSRILLIQYIGIPFSTHVVLPVSPSITNVIYYTENLCWTESKNCIFR